jgi:hypothetical protein
MGYVTSEPGSRDYDHIMKKGKVNDIDDLDMIRWCEYIFYRGLIRFVAMKRNPTLSQHVIFSLGYGRISHGGLSDTELQIARFKIPKNSAKFEDHYHVTLNPDNVPKRDLFNPM